MHDIHTIAAGLSKEVVADIRKGTHMGTLVSTLQGLAIEAYELFGEDVPVVISFRLPKGVADDIIIGGSIGKSH
jgi:hypothetical protein